MKSAWKNLSMREKIVLIICFIASILAIIFCIVSLVSKNLNLTGIAIVLLGVNIVLSSIMGWKSSKRSSIIGIITAVLIFIIVLSQYIF